jgi:hypothetical protein
MSECDTLPVPYGRNRWVLARTDRDAANVEAVVETAAAYLSRVLGYASPDNTRSLFERISVMGDDSRYVIGAACPVVISASQPSGFDELAERLNLQGTLLGLYTKCHTLRTVNAQKPWIVSVEFDWRAPDTAIKWPRRSVNMLGVPSTDGDHDLDWLLLGAYHAGDVQEPTCGSWWAQSGEYVGEQVAEVVEKVKGAVMPWLVLGVVGISVGVGLALTSKGKRR